MSLRYERSSSKVVEMIYIIFPLYIYMMRLDETGREENFSKCKRIIIMPYLFSSLMISSTILIFKLRYKADLIKIESVMTVIEHAHREYREEQQVSLSPLPQPNKKKRSFTHNLLVHLSSSSSDNHVNSHLKNTTRARHSFL